MHLSLPAESCSEGGVVPCAVCLSERSPLSRLVTVLTYEEMPTGARGKVENALQSSGVNDSWPPADGTV